MKQKLLSSFKKDPYYTQVIAEGSKTFYWASRFLSPQFRMPLYWLYSWCRKSDDAVDEVKDRDTALKNLAQMNALLDAAVTQAKTLKSPSAPSTVEMLQSLPQPVSFLSKEYQGLVGLLAIYQVDEAPLRDLLRGYTMDLQGIVYPSWSQLLDYCYCVAGTVGVIFAQILQIRNPQALEAAKFLGMAFQLTNIIRDFETDYQKGRIYIPIELLPKDQQDSSLDWARKLSSRKYAAQQIFQVAESFYEKAYQGFVFLPFRERLAVAVATELYRYIGVKALKSENPWSDRLFTTTVEKLFLTLRGICLAVYFSEFFSSFRLVLRGTKYDTLPK